MLLVPLLLYRSSLSDSLAFFFFSVFSSLFSSLILFAYYFTLNIDFCVQCFFSLFSALYIYIYMKKLPPLFYEWWWTGIWLLFQFFSIFNIYLFRFDFCVHRICALDKFKLCCPVDSYIVVSIFVVVVIAQFFVIISIILLGFKLLL